MAAEEAMVAAALVAEAAVAREGGETTELKVQAAEVVDLVRFCRKRSSCLLGSRMYGRGSIPVQAPPLHLHKALVIHTWRKCSHKGSQSLERPRKVAGTEEAKADHDLVQRVEPARAGDERVEAAKVGADKGAAQLARAGNEDLDLAVAGAMRAGMEVGLQVVVTEEAAMAVAVRA